MNRSGNFGRYSIIKANGFAGFAVILFAAVHSCTFTNSELMFSASVEVSGE